MLLRPFLIRQNMSTLIPSVKNVDIDPKGVFKYILLKITSPNVEGKMEEKLIVRGYADCPYHGKIYNVVQLIVTVYY